MTCAPSLVAAVAAVMEPLGLWWGFAGGWAIDLWIGEETREHHDIEVVVRRIDQLRLHAALADRWDLQCLDPPGSGWTPWSGVPMRPPAFQLQAHVPTSTFDLFVEAVDDERWTFRRDARITRGADDVLLGTPSGFPVVRPEIQLLYMASSQEPKNEHDLAVAGPRLSTGARTWLGDALATVDPGHRWLERLRR